MSDVTVDLKTLTWEIDEINSKNLAKQALPLKSMVKGSADPIQALPKGTVHMIKAPDPKNDGLLKKMNGENGGRHDQARERAKAKIQEIRKLRKENQSLKTKVTNHDQQLHATLTEIKVRDKRITELETLNGRLKDHLEQESANLKFYKKRVKNFDEDTQKYRDRIRELIELKTEETEVRQKLETELKTLSSELMTARELKLQADEKANNIQKKLEIRIQLGEEMKVKFKEEKDELQVQVTAEHEKYQHSLQQAENLALDVVKLSKENMSLEKELTKQDETIQGIFAETQSQQEVIKLLQSENRTLRKDLTKNQDERERLETELETANDRLAKMAERVYYLVNRLTYLEDYKKETERKLRVNIKEMEEVQHRVKQLQGQVQQEIEAKLTVEDEVKALRQSTVEFRKSATDYENKFKKLRKTNKKMQELLQAKTLKLRELLASNEVRMRKNQDDSSSRNMYATLQKKIDQLINSSEFLKKKVHHLERVNSKYQYTIRKREGEIKELKKRTRLITAFSATQSHSKLKRSPRGETGSGVSPEELYDLLTGPLGEHVEEFLNFYELDEQTFFKSVFQPLDVIRHIVARHTRVQAAIRINPADPDSRKVQQLERANADATSRLHEYEDVKVKSVMRLASVLANSRGRRSQLPTVLSLTENLLDDVCAQALAEALQGCAHIAKVDFRNNQIGDAGMMALVGATLANESITHLILRDNRVTLAGMKTLFWKLSTLCDDPPEFERLNNRKIALLNVVVQEREIYIDLRENNFDSDMLKLVEKVEEKDVVDTSVEEEQIGARYERWLVSQMGHVRTDEQTRPRTADSSGGRPSSRGSTSALLSKSASTPAFSSRSKKSSSRKKKTFGNDTAKLKDRLKASALQSSSKIG